MHNHIMYAANHDMYQFTEFKWFNIIQAIFDIRYIYICPYKLGFSQVQGYPAVIVHDI